MRRTRLPRTHPARSKWLTSRRFPFIHSSHLPQLNSPKHIRAKCLPVANTRQSRRANPTVPQQNHAICQTPTQQTKLREGAARGVARRPQHRRRPSGRRRSAAGMWGGNEVLRSEMPGGGAAPQINERSGLSTAADQVGGDGAQPECGEATRCFAPRCRGAGPPPKSTSEAASAPPPTKWEATERSRNVGRQRGASLRDAGGRGRPPNQRARRPQHRRRPSGRRRSAAGMWGVDDDSYSQRNKPSYARAQPEE